MRKNYSFISKVTVNVILFFQCVTCCSVRKTLKVPFGKMKEDVIVSPLYTLGMTILH
jgi:hypothetical protein